MPSQDKYYCGYSILPKHIYEAFPPETWDSQPFSTAEGPHTYTWDTAKYGGSGSYTAVGPVGAGTYILESYDFTKNLATLKKFQNHWARSMLESKGYYTVETYKVWWIESKDAAIAALKNHEVNVLDNNYSLYRDIKTLKDIGANVITVVDLGDQEMGFNMKHPVFGTGVDTPAGKADPSQAAEAARHIRKAISFLIPRQLIIDQLLAGGGVALATDVGPAWGPYYDPNLKADPYDPNQAVQELKAAGYSVAITAPAKIASSGTPILGQPIRVQGATAVAGMVVVVQQSSDQQTWKSVAATAADSSGNYQVSVPGPPVFGSTWYRANFTGYALNATEYGGQAISTDKVDWLIQNASIGGGPRMIPESMTDPIAISSVTSDAGTVLAVVIVLIVIALVAMRRRKPSAPAPAKQ